MVIVLVLPIYTLLTLKIAVILITLLCLSVHSLAIVISLKMEIPEIAWKEDPNGIAFANYVNAYLPNTVRVFSILPSQR